MKDRRLFHRRLFLNDGEGMAAVEAEVHNRSHDQTDEKGKKTGTRYVNIDANVQITDCSRSWVTGENSPQTIDVDLSPTSAQLDAAFAALVDGSVPR